MSKKLLVLGIMLVFLIVGFSGCVEDGDTNNKNNDNEKHDIGGLELVSYYVETYSNDMMKIGNGFVHGNNSYWYVVNGTVKNNLGRISNIKVNISFFNIKNTFLDSTVTYLYNVSDNQEETFSLRIHLNYFNETEKVTFILSES